MKTALSLYLPRWPTDRVRRRLHLDARSAVLLTRMDHQRELVAACCERAEAAGVVAGMTLAHARSLLPAKAVHVEEHDAAREAAHLKRLAAWCLRFTPVVAVDPPDGVLLDATGCERLYGGLKPMALRLINHVRRQGFAARIGMAPTWRGAKALARFGPHHVSLAKPDRVREALSELPIESMGFEAVVQDSIRAVGLDRIGQVLALPRSAVASRYGDDVLVRLDQALGQGLEIITPVRLKRRVLAECVLDGPTDRLDSIEAVVRDLLTSVVKQLASRESGARWLVLTLYRSDLDPLTIPVRLAAPSRDTAHLWALLRFHLESAHLGFGVEGITLEALSIATLPHRQQLKWEAANAAQPEGLSRFIDLARGRGLRVMRPTLVASHWPERADQLTELGDAPRPRGTVLLKFAERPTFLLSPPRSLKVTLLLPDGPLVAVRVDDVAKRVIACIGPERIEAEWWRRDGPARDYFKVQTEDGRWLWVYRHARDGGWFLHGVWA